MIFKELKSSIKERKIEWKRKRSVFSFYLYIRGANKELWKFFMHFVYRTIGLFCEPI